LDLRAANVIEPTIAWYR